jgi:outer membrane protein TolC
MAGKTVPRFGQGTREKPMHSDVGTMRRLARRMWIAVCVLGLGACTLPAQEKLPALAAPVAAAAAPLTLDDCIHLAFERQPALSAARASLAAAEDGRHALDNLPIYARCMTRELPFRKQQACLGVTIASAQLLQAEWEARYAVTRNYFSVIYVRLQQDLLSKVIKDAEKGRKRAKELLDSRNPDVKVTQIDIDLFDINIDLLRARQVEATVGEQKALAALREAIGIGPEHPLEITPGTLPAALDGLDREALIKAALANRGELTQVTAARQVTELEIAAQDRNHFGLKVGTFAGAADIHAQPVPQGTANGEYRPGAIGPEMPPMLVGKHNDRVARAADLSARAGAVVDKTYNLVSLEADNGYLKWLEARDKLKNFAKAQPTTLSLADRAWKRFEGGNTSGSEYMQATTLQDQVRAQYNDALYMHALSLAALERITAGGFRIYPQKHP